ncbi:TetR/AcrR family transcriptional regulator [Amycolatopsis jejuensis]|uniref:TetR/AcrR family transcriptional regulator n=1 Tax=Amycolatopsis jejuensis TaxID=330084 RepID=UPI0012E002E0|nr:TetR/AcrR family transcriptional regulator [Amycolatopsis jejuensis]
MNTRSRQAPESSRDRRRRETRAALLESAYTTFCEVGYAAASLETIAADAGFTRGALYANFSSKEDLFLTLAEDRAESLFAELHTIGSAEIAAEKAGWVIGTWVAESFEERRGWLLANNEFSLIAARDPALATRRLATIRHGHAALGETLARLCGPGVRERGMLAMTLVDGVIMHASLDPEIDMRALIATGLQRILAD